MAQERHEGENPRGDAGAGMEGRERLTDLARGINTAHRKHSLNADAARRHAQTAREHLKRLTLMILEARERVDEEGLGWGKWVEENLTFSQDHAARYLRVGRAHRKYPSRVTGSSLREQLASIGSPVERRAVKPGLNEHRSAVSGTLPGTSPGTVAGVGSSGLPPGEEERPARGAKLPPRPSGIKHALVRYWGSKWDLAPKIVKLFPEHRVFVEPYLGSGAVFLTKDKSKHEVINDINDEIVNLFEVVRKYPEELMRGVSLTPTAETEVRLAGETLADGKASLDPVERARRFLVVSHQAHLRLVGPPSYSVDTSPTARSLASRWKNIPQKIWPVFERLRDADLRNTGAPDDGREDGTREDVGVQKKDAVTLIRENPYPDALIYCDPPYVAEKRSKDLYIDDTAKDPGHHKRLVKALAEHPGYVYLSGYRNRLYEEELEAKRGWTARELEDPDPAHPDREVEVLWLNPKAQATAKEMEAEAARKKAEEKANCARQERGMGMVYMPPPASPEPEIKPEVALFGALIGAYLEGEQE